MSTPSTTLSPVHDKMYMLAYIGKAEKTSPHAYNVLRDLAVAVTAVSLAAIFSYPIAAAAIGYSGLTFTASYLISLPTLTVAIDIILYRVNASKHWFDIRAAALILEPKEKGLNLAFFQQFFPYHYQHEAAAVKLPSAPAKPAPTPSGHPQSADTRVPLQRAVIMGMNYKDVKGGQFGLGNCINDAIHIRELLLNTGSEPEDITLMVDSKENQGKDIYPVKQNIIKQLKKAIVDANAAVKRNPNAILYVHDSGHGTQQTEKVAGTQPGGKSDAMVTAELDVIVDSDLKKIIQGQDASDPTYKGLDPDASALFTMDCCHSGTMLDLPHNYKFVVNSGKEEIQVEETSDELSYGSVILISGCEDPQTSADGGTIHGQGSGAMTAAYYATLEEHGYHVTWRQLLIGINDKIKACGIKQNPQLSSSRKIDLDSYAVTSQIRFHPQIKKTSL